MGAKCNLLWHMMVLNCRVCPYMAWYGLIWHRLVLYGLVWSPVVLYSQAWPFSLYYCGFISQPWTSSRFSLTYTNHAWLIWGHFKSHKVSWSHSKSQSVKAFVGKKRASESPSRAFFGSIVALLIGLLSLDTIVVHVYSSTRREIAITWLEHHRMHFRDCAVRVRGSCHLLSNRWNMCMKWNISGFGYAFGFWPRAYLQKRS